MERETKNIAASVHQRLLNKAKVAGRPFNEVLQYFAMERFIYRLSKSPNAEKFILKGALMFTAWEASVSRPTKDIDLLGRTDNNIDVITAAMKKACTQQVEPDGMAFHAESVTARTITEDADYEGIRVYIQGNLGKARVSLQIDIGFGDVVVPKAYKIVYPTILDFPPPKLNGYTMESTIGEKFQAMVKLGSLNSRMKDFYDLWLLSRQFDFDGQVLATAIRKTFENRKTDIPSRPTALQNSFAKDSLKETQWRAFIRKAKLENAPGSFAEAVSGITAFLEPVISALVAQDDFHKNWKAPGPWR
jgi:hypothetical protein